MIKKSVGVSMTEEDSRSIAMLVQVASKYKSEVKICQENKTVNAKSIMGMMTLGLLPGQKLDIVIDGEDESDAMSNIEGFLSGK